MRYRGVLHVIRVLPTHYRVVFARRGGRGSEKALASCDIKGPTELTAFLASAGVKPEAAKAVLEAIIEKSSHSVEGLKLTDEDLDRLFPQLAQT